MVINVALTMTESDQHQHIHSSVTVTGCSHGRYGTDTHKFLSNTINTCGRTRNTAVTQMISRLGSAEVTFIFLSAVTSSSQQMTSSGGSLTSEAREISSAEPTSPTEQSHTSQGAHNLITTHTMLWLYLYQVTGLDWLLSKKPVRLRQNLLIFIFTSYNVDYVTDYITETEAKGRTTSRSSTADPFSSTTVDPRISSHTEQSKSPLPLHPV